MGGVGGDPGARGHLAGSRRVLTLTENIITDVLLIVHLPGIGLIYLHDNYIISTQFRVGAFSALPVSSLTQILRGGGWGWSVVSSYTGVAESIK